MASYSSAPLGINVESAWRSLDKNESLLTARISSFAWTALHIASGQGHGRFLEQLVHRMTAEEVGLQDLGGYTALHYAGSLPCVQAIYGYCLGSPSLDPCF